MGKTNCECPLAGYCTRHGVTKTPHLHKLCQNHDGYFEMWEQCRGPGQQGINCNKEEKIESKIEIINKSGSTENAKCEGCSNGQKMPSLIQQAKNLGGSVINHIKEGMKQATPEKQKERLDICYKCPLYAADSGRCTSCGCFLKVKASWESSKCPKGHW